MARPIYSGRISADTTSGLFSLASNVVGTTLYIQVTSGGGAGSNTLAITYQGCPNNTDSDSAKIFITDTDTSSFPSITISQADLPYTKIFQYSIGGVGRFNFDYSGGGTIIFNAVIYAFP